MGYFSNGTEGHMFQEAWCFNCRNWRDKDDGRGDGCPIWDAHLLFSYDECNSTSNAKTILDMLIRPAKVTAHDGLAVPSNECEMFLPLEPELVPGQLAIDVDEIVLQVRR